MQTYSIADARSQLPSIIHTVETGQVTQLTRRGKPVAILISPEEYKTLLAQGAGSLLQAYKAYRAIMTPTNQVLSDKEVESWRDQETGRKLPWE